MNKTAILGKCYCLYTDLVTYTACKESLKVV